MKDYFTEPTSESASPAITNTTLRRKNVIKKVYVTASMVVIIACFSCALYYYLMLNYEERVSCRLTEDVVQINDLLASMYLVKTDSGYIAIDAGFNPAFVKKGLEYNRISPKEIKAIFLTHLDEDHVSGLDIFKKAKIYLPALEAKRLDANDNRFIQPALMPNFLHIENYTTVSNGSEIHFGNRKITCIALPGHTPGSMGFMVDDKYLFSGDAFRIKNGKLAEPFRKWFTSDINQLRMTIKKVAGLKDIRYVFSAHSGFTADFNFAVSN